MTLKILNCCILLQFETSYEAIHFFLIFMKLETSKNTKSLEINKNLKVFFVRHLTQKFSKKFNNSSWAKVQLTIYLFINSSRSKIQLAVEQKHLLFECYGKNKTFGLLKY